MKSLIRKLLPHFLLQHYRRFKRLREKRRNQSKTTEAVFTEIYTMNKWGGLQGEFCSGDGTANEQIVAPYIQMVADRASIENFSDLTFADLGCGDFRVGKQLLPLCSSYIGVDIVQPLIQRNQEMYGDAHAQFIHLNIVQDELPNGDVCFIRQVLQHLSNQQIVAVLQKLTKYKWVFITEHYPTDNDMIKPNRDKTHGCDIRVYENSGVYLTEPPFELPKQELEEVLEVPGTKLGKGDDPGVIRTFLYKPTL
jgi:hypothetical protein